MRFSPLFWPIKFKNNIIYILDETALPQKLSYIKAKNYQQACQAIRDMKTRAVGQVILVFYIFLQVIKLNSNEKNLFTPLETIGRQDRDKVSLTGFTILHRVTKAINSTRPTLPFRVLTDMVLDWAKKGAPLEKNILGFLEVLKDKRIQQAEVASRFIKDKDVILTHCNVSGLMPLIGQFCQRQNKRLSFFVTQTSPYLQGLRLSAWELKRSGFKVTVIADNMVAQVMSEGKIDKVIVGADHLAQNGDIANKIGTYQIALLAKHFKIPFYVLCPPVAKTKTGREIKIEIRPDKEMLEFAGRRLAPKGIKGYYPAFDITPNNLITKHIYLEPDK